MKSLFTIKRKLLLVALSSIGITYTANASISNALNDYYNNLSATTKIENPSKLQSGTGMTLGGFYMNNKNVDMNLGHIDPVSINAGCGGIHVNLGAMSFVNGAQIEEAIKALPQNASGLILTEGIGLISPQLEAEINHWIAEINKWMGVLKNSCQMAQALVGGANELTGSCERTARSGWVQGRLADEAAVQQNCDAFHDGIDSIQNVIYDASFGKIGSKAIRDETDIASIYNGMVKNAIAKSMTKKGLYSGYADNGLGNLILSLTGDIYIPTPGGGTKSGEFGVDEKVGPTPPSIIEATITPQQLMVATSESEGGKKIATVYNCDFTWDVKNNQTSESSPCWTGTTYKTSQDPTALTALPNLIANKIDRLHNKMLALQDLDQSDLAFISLVNTPIYAFMQSGIDAGVDDATYPVMQQYAQVMSREIYYSIISGILADIDQELAMTVQKNPSYAASMSMLSENLANKLKDIHSYVEKDENGKTRDFLSMMETINTLKATISANIDGDMQDRLAFAGDIKIK